MPSSGRYTFGDNDEASVRLRRLAELYESETRELLLRDAARKTQLAIDLGCGPGWTTRLLHDTLHPARTVGLDASARYIDEARCNRGQDNQSSPIEFHVHDVTQTPFPVPAPDALLCRFLLTHLHKIAEVLSRWAKASAPDCVLFIHETESMNADHPALRRYYELVAQLQRHYGQTLEVGALLEGCVAKSGWRMVESTRLELRKPASAMAQIHLANLRTWRHDDYARQTFDASEIDALEASLTQIAASPDSSAVINIARQVIARCR